MSEAIVQDLQPGVADSYDRLRAECGRVQLPGFALIELTGEDRKGWLQGQVTNDVRQLDLGASYSFCVCEPTGQILSVCDVWSLPERFFLTCPIETVPALLKRFEQMVIMEDVRARDVTGEYELASIQGPAATAQLSELVELPKLDAGVGSLAGTEVYCLRSDRTGLGGWDIVVPKDATKSLKLLDKTFQPILAEAYEIARLEAGIPRYGKDYDAKTLPPELGPAFEAKHISYSKGCYTGQEVLMRIHSRGHTNRRWMALYSDSPFQEGSTISHPRRPDAGKVTSAVLSPDFGYVGAAMLRREVAEDYETVRIEGPEGVVEAETRLMPILRLE
jgi:tRNA-modifying protein YgfZ